MSEEKWTCPKCKQVYLMDNSDVMYDGIQELYRMTCGRCRNKGDIVLLMNELGMKIRNGTDISDEDKIYRNIKANMEG